MPWMPLDPSLCAYCGGNGIFPLTDVPGRTDFAVCECQAGKRWRYDKQIDRRGKVHTVTPQWHLWASEYGISVRNGVQRDPRSAIDLMENWQGRE